MRGIVILHGKRAQGSATIHLASATGSPFDANFHQDFEFSAASFLPGIKYFQFDNVPPGDYIAFATTTTPESAGWFTSVNRITVANHAKWIELDLFRQQR